MPAETGRWARLRRSLWQPPRPHGEAPRERVVGPLEVTDYLAERSGLLVDDPRLTDRAIRGTAGH